MAGSVLFLPILGFDSPSKKFDSSMGSTLFAGKSVGLSTSKCPEYHGVLSQGSLLQLIERGSPVVIPFNELLLIVGHNTDIQIYQLVQCQVCQHLLRFLRASSLLAFLL